MLHLHELLQGCQAYVQQVQDLKRSMQIQLLMITNHSSYYVLIISQHSIHLYNQHHQLIRFLKLVLSNYYLKCNLSDQKGNTLKYSLYKDQTINIKMKQNTQQKIPNRGQLPILSQNHRGRPFKGNQEYKVLPGYIETQFSIVDYFDKFGISGGLLFQQEQDFYRKNSIESEFSSSIRQIIDDLIITVKQAKSLTVDDFVVLLNALTTCVDNMCINQYCHLLLTIFKSVGATEDIIQKLKDQFLQTSFFFSLKFKQLAKNSKNIKPSQNLTTEMVERIKKKISKNVRSMNKKKQNKKKKQKKNQDQDQGESQQEIKILNEDKQTIKQHFDILFDNLRKDVVHFVTDVNHRQQYLAQQRTMNAQLVSLVNQAQNN